MYEERYWPVLVSRYNDLPIHIRNGQATPEARQLTFPYAIKVLSHQYVDERINSVHWMPTQELMSCKSDYIPVMVPGTSAFGWVPTIFCKQWDGTLALQEYKESLKSPEELCDLAFRRSLKGISLFLLLPSHSFV